MDGAEDVFNGENMELLEGKADNTKDENIKTTNPNPHPPPRRLEISTAWLRKLLSFNNSTTQFNNFDFRGAEILDSEDPWSRGDQPG